MLISCYQYYKCHTLVLSSIHAFQITVRLFKKDSFWEKEVWATWSNPDWYSPYALMHGLPSEVYSSNAWYQFHRSMECILVCMVCWLRQCSINSIPQKHGMIASKWWIGGANILRTSATSTHALFTLSSSGIYPTLQICYKCISSEIDGAIHRSDFK